MTVLNEISARRQHQAQKGYDAPHDDEHNDGSILKAAACYLGRSQGWNPDGYPWGRLPPGSCREDLLDAAALIVAEIERMDRALREKLQATYNDLLAMQGQSDQVPLATALDAVGVALEVLRHD